MEEHHIIEEREFHFTLYIFASLHLCIIVPLIITLFIKSIFLLAQTVFRRFSKLDKNGHRMVQNCPILKKFCCRDIYFLWEIRVCNQNLSSTSPSVAVKRKKMYVIFLPSKKTFPCKIGTPRTPQ